MKNKIIVGLIIGSLSICFAFGGAFLGIHVKEKKIEQVKVEDKARELQYKFSTADMVGKMIDKDHARRQADLEKSIKEEIEQYKNEKPIQYPKKLTEEQIEDMNKG